MLAMGHDAPTTPDIMGSKTGKKLFPVVLCGLLDSLGMGKAPSLHC